MTRIAETLGDGKALTLQNHGLLTVGPIVEAAAWWFIAMDNAARTRLPAEAAGTHRGGYVPFQPPWDSIIATDPDLSD